MKRIFYFFSGTVLLIFMAYYSIKTWGTPEFQGYIESLESYGAFPYVYYSFIGVLFLIALILLILAFRPSHRKRKLIWQTHFGELEVSKKAVESYIIKSITQFDHVRLDHVQTILKSRKNRKEIAANINVLWLPSHDSNEASLEEISDYIKSKLEEFTNANVEGIKIQVIDQAKTDTRVI